MGLRTKIIASLLGILALLALVSTQVLRKQLSAEFAVQERVEVQKDMQRLLLALDHQLTALDVVLGSWSNFTSLYEYAAHPTTKFRDNELSADSLRSSRIDWMILADSRGHIYYTSEVPREDGSLPFEAMREDPANQVDQRLAKLLNAKSEGCGVFSTGTVLGALCFRPLLTSDGKGPPRGALVIGRQITPESISDISRETGLGFELTPVVAQPAKAAAEHDLVALTARGTLTLTTHEEHIDTVLPLIGITGMQVGEVRMHWPRSSLAHMESAQQSVLLNVLILVLATGLAAMFILDRLVVRRLDHIRRDLSRILEQEDWSGEVKAAGNDEIAELARFANSMMDIIKSKMSELREMALHDNLTGLANRRKFDDRLRLALSHHQRTQDQSALVLFDVDYFKRYNDAYGHPAGDQALIQVAGCLKQGARRPGDLASRLGGEEFAMLLDHCDAAGSQERAELVRNLLLQQGIAHTGNPEVGFLTLSSGIALFRADDTPESVYARADAALYAAKSQGRNRTVVGQ